VDDRSWRMLENEKEVEIEVTLDDIIKGERWSNTNCALARCLRRNKLFGFIKLTNDAVNFVSEFDAHGTCANTRKVKVIVTGLMTEYQYKEKGYEIFRR
jgi:hypothetical protein